MDDWQAKMRKEEEERQKQIQAAAHAAQQKAAQDQQNALQIWRQSNMFNNPTGR